MNLTKPDIISSKIETQPPLQRFGLQVALKRKMAGFSATQFAIKTGLRVETITAIEMGYAGLDVISMNLNSIASGLGITENVLQSFLRFLISEEES